MTGLREKKKQKTRDAIQQHALQLFKVQGYEATTVEQIAAAAEVSPSTFFRYFPTKEDVVIYDAFDPILLATLRAQPKHMNVITAVRAMMKQVFLKMTPAERDAQLEREALFRSVPELTARMLESVGPALSPFVDAIAERAGKPASDMKVQALAGAILGVAVLAWQSSGPGLQKSGIPAYVAKLDRYLAELERGFD
jgi:AcrR family transcriptional regulator